MRAGGQRRPPTTRSLLAKPRRVAQRGETTYVPRAHPLPLLEDAGASQQPFSPRINRASSMDYDDEVGAGERCGKSVAKRDGSDVISISSGGGRGSRN